MSGIWNSISQEDPRFSVNNGIGNVSFSIANNGNIEIWFNKNDMSVCLNFGSVTFFMGLAA